MRVIEVFLPVTFGSGDAVPGAVFDMVEQELGETFGDVAAYTRSPALGSWPDESKASEAEVVILEVRTDKIDKGWWKDFRKRVEGLYRQQGLVIRYANGHKL